MLSNLIVIASVVGLALALTVKDFQPTLFSTSKPSGFYNIDTGDTNEGLITGFGDLNGDKFTDYVAMRSTTVGEITVFIWDAAAGSFSSQSLELDRSNFTSVSEILICDMDRDGLVELLVVYQMEDQTYSGEVYDTQCGSTCSITLQGYDFTLLDSMTAIPFLLDRKGDGAVSIFTFKGTARSLVFYDHQQIAEQSFTSVQSGGSPQYNPVSLHFSSQVDFNGDCNADLVIVSHDSGINQVIQFYTKSHNNKYTRDTFLKMDKNITWVEFADLDSSGSVDMLLVALEEGQYKPYILENVNHPNKLCNGAPNFPYDLGHLYPITLPQGWKLLEDSRPHLADFDYDGYPDILAIFSINNFRKASILHNKNNFGYDIFHAASTTPLEDVGNPVQTAVYDFSQDGRFDVIIVRNQTKADSTQALVRTSIFNNIIEDSLFIKILPLLASGTGEGLDRRDVSGAVGITIEWRITDLDGDKRVNLLNQRCQWNFGTLQLPFASLGLGRTNNYIQDLTVGYPGLGQTQEWTPVIPNSQLMVQRKLGGEQWQLQTLLHDQGRVYDVMYISVVCLVVLGLIIAFLNWRETQQDKRNQYNFVQMIR